MANNNEYQLPKDFVHPGLPSRCTWKLGSTEKTVHSAHALNIDRPKTIPNILSGIGFTPLVKLNKIPKSEGIQADLFVKVEFFNPGGSIKDRISVRMLEEAENKGLLKSGMTVIERSSGNSGIGLAMACAVKGYKCLIVMPDRMSNEKVYVMKALGATIIKTPADAEFGTKDYVINVAQRLNKEIENSIVLDQFRNSGNPLAHYDGTAEEILWQMDNKIDAVVIGAGTGGTIAGIGRKIKEKLPSCKVVGLDPFGSYLAHPEELNKTDVKSFEVEGIGYNFASTVLDRSVVDEWIKVADDEAFQMARRLNKEEGILSGGSSGSAMVAALKASKTLKAGQRVVVVLADGIRNYMTKYVSDNWMEARGFKEVVNEHNHWWWNHKVSELIAISTPAVVIDEKMTCQDAINLIKEKNVQFLPILRKETGKIVGVVTMEALTNEIVSHNVCVKSSVTKGMYKKVIKVTEDSIIGKVARILEVEDFVLVLKTENEKDEVIALLARRAFLEYICHKPNNGVRQ
ncbi:CBS.2 family protein [Megaselia abdita]